MLRAPPGKTECSPVANPGEPPLSTSFGLRHRKSAVPSTARPQAAAPRPCTPWRDLLAGGAGPSSSSSLRSRFFTNAHPRHVRSELRPAAAQAPTDLSRATLGEGGISRGAGPLQSARRRVSLTSVPGVHIGDETHRTGPSGSTTNGPDELPDSHVLVIPGPMPARGSRGHETRRAESRKRGAPNRGFRAQRNAQRNRRLLDDPHHT